MSVTLAPRARIAENAACPGVSRKVIDFIEASDECGTGTENAPMCCVMPPASPLATDAERRVSKRVVLP